MQVYLRRYLEHKLVRTIEAQARAFREGVEGVTGRDGLSLLSAAELKQLWGGHEARAAPAHLLLALRHALGHALGHALVLLHVSVCVPVCLLAHLRPTRSTKPKPPP